MEVINKKYSYSQFREAVRQRLGSNLACFRLTPEQLEAYMREEESQVKGAYNRYASDHFGSVRKHERTEDACFRNQVCTVSYCLELCH